MLTAPIPATAKALRPQRPAPRRDLGVRSQRGLCLRPARLARRHRRRPESRQPQRWRDRPWPPAECLQGPAADHPAAPQWSTTACATLPPGSASAPHRNAPHRTAPHRIASHRGTVSPDDRWPQPAPPRARQGRRDGSSSVAESLPERFPGPPGPARAGAPGGVQKKTVRASRCVFSWRLRLSWPQPPLRLRSHADPRPRHSSTPPPSRSCSTGCTRTGKPSSLVRGLSTGSLRRATCAGQRDLRPRRAVRRVPGAAQRPCKLDTSASGASASGADHRQALPPSPRRHRHRTLPRSAPSPGRRNRRPPTPAP
jgi:hypothetical protein